MNVPLHYSMKENFWIYISCLLFCAAIGHRVWEYEKNRVDCRPLATALGEYHDSMSASYWSKRQLLQENLKRKRRFNVYRDSMLIINYLLDNNEIDKLMEMCSSNAIDKMEIQRTGDLPIRIQKLRYANLLLDFYCSITRPEKSKSTVEIESKIVNYNEVGEVQYEIEFDFYSLFTDKVDVIYTIGGEYIPDKLGGGATKFAPNEIDVLIKDKISGERKKYEFDNIKV